jgi:hypothetical protein
LWFHLILNSNLLIFINSRSEIDCNVIVFSSVEHCNNDIESILNCYHKKEFKIELDFNLLNKIEYSFNSNMISTSHIVVKDISIIFLIHKSNNSDVIEEFKKFSSSKISNLEDLVTFSIVDL